MAQVKSTFWNCYKYKLSGLVLILPFYFLYQSLNPVFPDTWEVKEISGFEVTPMPYNLDAPYLHHDTYTKDFFLMFKGDISSIRQAYLNLGPQALPLSEFEKGDEGVLHGSQHGQEVHAISTQTLSTNDKAWLTIQDWQGNTQVINWDLPQVLTQ